MGASLYDIDVKTIDGKATTLGEFKGSVLLVVNVASACGLTPQYNGLERLHETYAEKGLRVLAFPSNDFGKQEPGNEAQIKTFCEQSYHVRFPMFSKIPVRGPNKHPLYAALVSEQPKATQPNGNVDGHTDVSWNFEKFLVGKDGKVVGRFASSVEPDSAIITQAIESALAA